jgi:hypothetical protein
MFVVSDCRLFDSEGSREMVASGWCFLGAEDSGGFTNNDSGLAT